jgi:hypothetical protein
MRGLLSIFLAINILSGASVVTIHDALAHSNTARDGFAHERSASSIGAVNTSVHQLCPFSTLSSHKSALNSIVIKSDSISLNLTETPHSYDSVIPVGNHSWPYSGRAPPLL